MPAAEAGVSHVWGCTEPNGYSFHETSRGETLVVGIASHDSDANGEEPYARVNAS